MTERLSIMPNLPDDREISDGPNQGMPSISLLELRIRNAQLENELEQANSNYEEEKKKKKIYQKAHNSIRTSLMHELLEKFTVANQKYSAGEFSSIQVADFFSEFEDMQKEIFLVGFFNGAELIQEVLKVIRQQKESGEKPWLRPSTVDLFISTYTLAGIHFAADDLVELFDAAE